MTAHERMYVLVSAIYTLTLCMCMIVCTIRSVLISMYVCTCMCINYVYIEPKGYSINAMYCDNYLC